MPKNITRDEQRSQDAINQKLYAATKDPLSTPSITVTNATANGLYRGNAMASVRQGANDFQNSLPMSAMIRIK